MLLAQMPGVRFYGPYLVEVPGQPPRRYVAISYDDGRASSTSYARWLMGQHLGRQLLPEEHVDHIDNDSLHDEISNYQLLSPAANTRKSARPRATITFMCPVCGIMATKPADKVRHNRKQGKAGPFCGKSCAGFYSSTI